jgi:RNA polymerase sigma-70 factor (ECF subfamily)
MATEPLLIAFLARARCTVRREEELQVALEAKVSAAQNAWPDIVLPPETFAAYLAERIAVDDEACRGLAQIRERDLYIACAALAGVPRALELFDRMFLSRISGFISWIDRSPTFTNEVTQTLRVRLLMPSESGRGKLSQYSGRGALDSWLCAAATRTALSLVRAPRAAMVPQDELDILAASHDPEMEMLRRQHREAFRAAVQQALRALDPRQRTVLRLHYLEHATFARIGGMFQVHETTAMRWVTQAKKAISKQVQLILRQRLKLSQNGLNSLAQLMQSELEVSLARLLSSQSSKGR